MFVLLLIIAYLLGSLSSAIILCKGMQLPDPRTQGSGNPGATNVLRFSGKKLAVMVLLGDVLKGIIPILLAKYFVFAPAEIACVGIAVFLGHLFPVFFHFRGGKGVATAWGILLALAWPLGVAAGVTWLLVFLVFRYSSLAALVTATLMPVYGLYFTHSLDYVMMILCLSVLLFWRHRKNIDQLRAGTEKPFGRDKH